MPKIDYDLTNNCPVCGKTLRESMLHASDEDDRFDDDNATGLMLYPTQDYNVVACSYCGSIFIPQCRLGPILEGLQKKKTEEPKRIIVPKPSLKRVK